MGWQQTYHLINTLANIPSTNKKVEILKTQLDQFSLKCFSLALNQQTSYNIGDKKFPAYAGSSEIQSEDAVFNFLDTISVKRGANGADIMCLQKLLPTRDAYEVVKRIILKDLRCGVQASLLNKAVPKTVWVSPYMRCSTDKHIKNVVYPCYAQKKMDGQFANLITCKYSGEEYFSTRSGQIITRASGQLQQLFEGVEQALPEDVVYMGEFVCCNPDGTEMPRATSNGILNKILQGTATKAEEDLVCFFVWDKINAVDFFVTRKSLDPYYQRLLHTKDFVKNVNNPRIVQMVPYIVAENYDEAIVYYKVMRALDKEGAVLKNKKALWKDGTSTEQIKLKDVKEAEVVIVGFNYGKGKYADVVGALCYESSCGGLKGNLSGFSDELRAEFLDIKVGSIVSLLFNSVTEVKPDGTRSLYLPRYDKLRLDKTEADSLDDILKR